VRYQDEIGVPGEIRASFIKSEGRFSAHDDSSRGLFEGEAG